MLEKKCLYDSNYEIFFYEIHHAKANKIVLSVLNDPQNAGLIAKVIKNCNQPKFFAKSKNR